MYESQIEKLGGARMTIETQILSLEQATVTSEALRAMQEGAGTMKALHGTMYVRAIAPGVRGLSLGRRPRCTGKCGGERVLTTANAR